jgi:hypothetical protein
VINETARELGRDFPSLMHTPTQYSRVDWRLRLRERDEIKVNGGEGFRCRIILLDWAAGSPVCVLYLSVFKIGGRGRTGSAREGGRRDG